MLKLNSLRRIKPKDANAVLKVHHGSKRELAEFLGILPQSVSQWLKGQFTSERIEREAADFIRERGWK